MNGYYIYRGWQDGIEDRKKRVNSNPERTLAAEILFSKNIERTLGTHFST